MDCIKGTMETIVVSTITTAQCKSDSDLATIHPSWCTGGCWFTLAKEYVAQHQHVHHPWETHYHSVVDGPQLSYYGSTLITCPNALGDLQVGKCM